MRVVKHRLLTNKVLDMNSGCEGRVESSIARCQFGAFGDSVVVGAPHKFDGIANGGVYSEGNIAENALGWCDDDCVSNTVSDVAIIGTGLGWRRSPRLRRAAVLSKAF